MALCRVPKHEAVLDDEVTQNLVNFAAKNQVKTTHGHLASSNRNVKIGLLVLGSCMKKNNLNRKYNAMTTWRATCVKGHTSLMTQSLHHVYLTTSRYASK